MLRFYHAVLVLLFVTIALHTINFENKSTPAVQFFKERTDVLYTCDWQSFKRYNHTRTSKEKEVLSGVVETIYDPIQGEDAAIEWSKNQFLRENGRTISKPSVWSQRSPLLNSCRSRQLAVAILSDFLGHKYSSIADFAKSAYAKTLRILNTESRAALTEVLNRGICGAGWAPDKDCSFISSEYFGSTFNAGQYYHYQKLGKEVRHEDLRKLSFGDNSLDLIISTEIFEHIPGPYDAFREVHRVLKPSGMHIFTVPFVADSLKDEMHAELVEGGEVKWLNDGEPLYHVDGVRPEGIPVFQIFGQEVAFNLCNMGFKVKVKALRNIPEVGILGEGAIYFVTEKI